MSFKRRRYCIFRCDNLDEQGVPLHQFPHPIKRPDLYAAWVSAAAGKLQGSDDPMQIFRNRRICDQHFDPSTRSIGSRLICSAVPTRNLHRIQLTIRSITETDHTYCQPRRGLFHKNVITNPVLPDPSSAVTFPPSGSSASSSLTVNEKDTTQSTRMKINAGQTKRSISTRVKEHIADVKHRRPKSAVWEHVTDKPNHSVKFDKPQILAKEKRYVPRMLREAIEIKKYPNFNREDGFYVPSAPSCGSFNKTAGKTVRP